MSSNRYLAEVIDPFGLVFAGCGAIAVAVTLRELLPNTARLARS